MYPSSSSSSSQGSMGPSGLIRYGSAPGSFLAAAVDSVVGGATRDFSSRQQPQHLYPIRYSDAAAETSSVDGGDISTASITNLNSKSSNGGGSLLRHSSSPAGFLDHLSVYINNAASTSTASLTNGFPVTRGMGSYNPKEVSNSGHGISRLASQLSFTRQDSLSHISEETGENGHRKSANSYATASFGTLSWDDSNAISFSASPRKRSKSIGGEVVHCLNTVESQFQFGLSEKALDQMAATENLLGIPQDSVPCKIRAKRGFATHPRSIAERDRRTRINGKLKKLQELVPNLEKQTSYADMLDLAVQHIKGLENQVQKLKKEIEHCTCG